MDDLDHLRAKNDRLMIWVERAMAPLGTVTHRWTMGYEMRLDDVPFAVVDDGELRFLSDADSAALWDAANCPRHRISFGDGAEFSFEQRIAPREAYDDPDALRRWAMHGLAAGSRRLEAARRAKVKPKKLRKLLRHAEGGRIAWPSTKG